MHSLSGVSIVYPPNREVGRAEKQEQRKHS